MNEHKLPEIKEEDNSETKEIVRFIPMRTIILTGEENVKMIRDGRFTEGEMREYRQYVTDYFQQPGLTREEINSVLNSFGAVTSAFTICRRLRTTDDSCIIV